MTEREMIITPSMMCVDIMKMKETLSVFEEENIGYLHMDIMDGEFVPNYAVGTDMCDKLRNVCDIPLDIHLMVNRPEEKYKFFNIKSGDIVSVHVESTVHLQRVLAGIRDRGARPYAALNPATPICCIENVLDDIDGVLLMTVNPGYAGQNLIPACIDKIKKTRAFLDENGYGSVNIEVDGNVSFVNAEIMKNAGANVFVAGSSSVFYKGGTLTENIQKLKKAVGGN